MTTLFLIILPVYPKFLFTVTLIVHRSSDLSFIEFCEKRKAPHLTLPQFVIICNSWNDLQGDGALRLRLTKHKRTIRNINTHEHISR